MRATGLRLIVRINLARHALVMILSAPLPLSPEDKLDALRFVDEFHLWRSLEDERRCARCHEVITGRQVLVFERRGTRGRLSLQCPSAGCFSTARDWDYPNPLAAARLKNEFSRPPSRRKPSARPDLRYQGRVGPVRLKRRRRREHVNGRQPVGPPPPRQFPRSFRTALAGLPVLRSIVSGLHAFQPIA